MEEQSYLFSFDFILEKVSSIRNKCLCPGVVFLLMDFSPILIHLQRVGNPATESSKHLENIGGVAHNIRRGKSCLMDIGPQELLKELRERGAEVVLLDLQCEGSDPKVIGRAPLNLSTTLSSLEEALRTNKLLTENAHYCRQSVHVLDTTNKMVATVVVKHRLSTVDSSVRNHIPGNQSGMEHSHTHYATNTTEITVLSERKGGRSSTKASPQKKLSDQCAGSSAGTLAREKHKPSPQMRSDTALAVNGYTSPKKHSNEAMKPLKNSECTELSTAPQSEACYGSEGSVCCIGNLRACSNTKEEPESLAMYLPNSVCPPPLLYRSEPKSQATKTWQSKFHSNTTVGTVNGEKPYLSSNIDTVADHWSVLMAHDHCSYPITVTQNELRSDEVKSSQPTAPALPLLTALLEELSVLKSHIQLPQTTDNVTAFPKRESTGKATQCLQTDDIPDNISTARKVKKECIIKLPQQEKVQFVRECCLRKHGYSGSRRVPRNKSIIYPPDIARNRRKPGPKKAIKISEKPSTTASRSKKQRIISGQNTATLSKLETREAPPSNSQVPVEKVVSSPTIRKLEVFIPQVSYTARSSEANTPVLGSETSLHIAGEPKERSDAQTQTQNDNQGSHKMTDDATSTSISLENVSKNSNIEAPYQITDHETYNEELSEHEELSGEQSVHVNETRSKTAAENVNIVITQHSRRASLQLSQACPSPIPTTMAVDDSATALSLPIIAQFKPGSLLSIGSQAAYDSFMSIDSLDVAEKAVLSKNHRESCVVYLATSQSSVEIDGVGDEKDNFGSEAERISTQEEAYDYSDDFEQYSEDFEQFSTDSSSSSKT